MSEFKVGDVVQLKSGGPYMTVSSVNYGPKNDAVLAVWFANGESSEVKSSGFMPATLVRVEQE